MEQRQVILNVDDNDGARHAKSRLLANAGFQVEEAADGAEALAMAAELVPVLVVLDIKLPDMNGHDVCLRIKENPATAHVLVLQTSAAMIAPADKQRGLRSGADHYLSAPFEPSDLVSIVRGLLAPSSTASD
jgi:DNA-binding response OmpR family regulator